MVVPRKKPRRIWLFSVLNAAVMLALTYYWLSLPYTFGDESFLIYWSSLVKKKVLGFDRKPDPGEVLLVDVSHSKTTINVPNEWMIDTPYYRNVITDRVQLTELFTHFNRAAVKPRFVLCDILFEDTTRQDAALEQELQKLNDKLLIVSHLRGGVHHVRPVVHAPYAPATYTATNGLFLKFPLVLHDTLPTVPLVMYQKLNKAQFYNANLFYWLNNKLCLPSPVVDFKIRQADLGDNDFVGDKKFSIHQLGFLLNMANVLPPAEFARFFAGKTVLIGDFETDTHDTPFGELPGLLMIYNAYLTLQAEQYKISIVWIMFLLAAYTFISYRVFNGMKVQLSGWVNRLFSSNAGKFILNSLDEFAALIIITFLSYFIFNIHINILILFLYIKLIEFIWKQSILHVKPPVVKRKTLTT
jgi:hypothetical protein